MRPRWRRDADDVNNPRARVAALARAGEYDAAEQHVRGVADGRERCAALAALAAALLASDAHDRAERATRRAVDTAHEIADPVGRILALTGTASALVVGDAAPHAYRLVLDALLAAIDTADFRGTELGMLSRPRWRRAGADDPRTLVESLVNAGHLDDAEQVARALGDTNLGASACLDVVRALRSSGMIERAEDLARSAANPYHQSAALLAVLSGLLSAGNADQRIQRVAELAATAAEQITTPDTRADRLVETSNLCVSSARPACVALAERLMVEVLGGDTWRRALPLTGRIALPALQDLADQLIRDLARRETQAEPARQA